MYNIKPLLQDPVLDLLFFISVYLLVLSIPWSARFIHYILFSPEAALAKIDRNRRVINVTT